MLIGFGTLRVFVAREPVDLRRGFDGLAALAGSVAGQDPLSGHLFVFVNRRRDRMKVLYWERGGFCLWYKRLEAGVFVLPAGEPGSLEISPADLTMIVEGVDPSRVHRGKRFVRPASPAIAAP